VLSPTRLLAVGTLPSSRSADESNAKIIKVRHRSRATYSRQPRQVRKEATVTGSCVCSGPPVPGFFVAAHLRLTVEKAATDANS
jgi:hypothetical protein